MRSVASHRPRRIPPCVPTMAAYCGLRPSNGYPPGSPQCALLEALCAVGGPIPALLPCQGPYITTGYASSLSWLPAKDGLPDGWDALGPGERLDRTGTQERFFHGLQDQGALTPDNRQILKVLRALRDHDLETAKPLEVERPVVVRLVERKWADTKALDESRFKLASVGAHTVNLSARDITQAGWDFVIFWDDPNDAKYPSWWRG